MKAACLKLARDERGTMALEFTLLLPVFLMLLFSVIELGAAWYTQQMMVQASREGARLGALFSQAGTTNEEVEDAVLANLAASSFPGEAQVSVTGADGETGDMVQVDVVMNYTFPVLSQIIPAVAGSVTLSSRTVMRHE